MDGLTPDQERDLQQTVDVLAVNAVALAFMLRSKGIECDPGGLLDLALQMMEAADSPTQ